MSALNAMAGYAEAVLARALGVSAAAEPHARVSANSPELRVYKGAADLPAMISGGMPCFVHGERKELKQSSSKAQFCGMCINTRSS